ILIGIIGFLLLLFLIIIIQGIRLNKWKKRYFKMMGGKNFSTVEKMLIEHNHHISKVVENVEYIIDRRMNSCVQKLGVVRYNAFNDMGSDLSYSIAMLDNENTGVILSGITGRDFNNTYAKPVINGKSTYNLTDEEVLAMD